MAFDLGQEFKNRLLKNYSEKYPNATKQGLLDYLYQHRFIPTKEMKRYVILELFDELYQENNCHTTHTVMDISNRMQIGTTTIWTVLKDHKNRYQ